MDKPSSPTGHDLLIRVKTVATNPIDYKRLGNLGKHTEAFEGTEPLVVGWDAAGIVEQVGDETSLFQVGDEVMFAGDFFRSGAFAENVLVDERIVGPKPANLSWSQAASEPLTSLTAWEAIYDQLKVSPNKQDNTGKTILITGGAGGVATAAIALASKVLGLTVIATASRDESRDFVRLMGAHHVINHRENLTRQIQEELGIEAVDYILHTVDLTGDLFTEFVGLIKPFGGICSIWPSATVDLFQLFWKSVNFSAVLMFTRPGLKNQESKRQHDILTQLCQLLEDGTLPTRQTNCMELTADNLRTALEMQASGKSVGKMALYFEE